MKYCKHCGAEIDDACVVCPKCGKQVEETKPNTPTPPNMRVCKVCGKPIAKSAKVCPHCGAKKKGKAGLIIGIIVAVIVVFAVAGGGSKKTDKPSSNASGSSESKAEAQQEKIEYKEATMLDLTKALEANAMNAEDTYQGQYYKVTGTIVNIDSDGDYISIDNGEDFMSGDVSLYSMMCMLKDEDAKNKIRKLSKGDTVTVSGKITDVGEVLGYKMDVDVIE